jgi:ethanolamine utilization cobalamin adenosyltransferase
VHALHEAGRKLAAASPNGRDYYVQGSASMTAAMSQHEARMNKLREIIKELETIADGIDC